MGNTLKWQVTLKPHFRKPQVNDTIALITVMPFQEINFLSFTSLHSVGFELMDAQGLKVRSNSLQQALTIYETHSSAEGGTTLALPPFTSWNERGATFDNYSIMVA